MSKKNYTAHEKLQMKRAMEISLAVAFFLLGLKMYAWWITGSTAILSDAIESIVHIFAVGFATYSLWLSLKPADADHTYGHDRIAFFSAGLEGGLILAAAVYIAVHAIKKMLIGVTLENVGEGLSFVWVAMVLNGLLGLYLIRQGRRYSSLVLMADGRHILTDCFTSAGVIAALLLTKWTGILLFDPLIALIIALNIFYTGAKLIWNAVSGLMDRADPETDKKIREILDRETSALHLQYHHLRHRNTGSRIVVEVHLLFPEDLSLFKAHEMATLLEKKIEDSFGVPIELVTHLEPLEGHDEFHRRLLGHSG